jgi:ribonuclease Z
MATLSRHLADLSSDAAGGSNEASVSSLPFVLTMDKVRVDHCPHAYGLVLAIGMYRICSSIRGSSLRESLEPFLFCYSGDTRPCPELVRACDFHSRRHGRAGIIDFLLHEATFSDEDRDQSLKKRHSTVGEACLVARQVGARRTLLTHFSQRYNSANRGKCSWPLNGPAPPGHPRPLAPIMADESRVMAAADGLRIKLFEYS